jgi:hypothetical protein
MATIRRLRGRWQAMVRRRGVSPRCKSFDKRTDATRWARELEAEADRSGWVADTRLAEKTTLGELLTRYRDQVSPTKRSAHTERSRINAMVRRPIAHRTLAKLTSADIATYRDGRLKDVAPATVVREAGRFLPNCFGSEFLHDPESADCGPCKFSESCKKTIVDEMPLLETARKAREAHFRITGRDKLPPTDPKRIEFLRNILRGHHLAKYRKAQERRRTKDKAYQQERRANPDAETLIEKELQERLAACRT